MDTDFKSKLSLDELTGLGVALADAESNDTATASAVAAYDFNSHNKTYGSLGVPLVPLSC